MYILSICFSTAALAHLPFYASAALPGAPAMLQ
jgi:hypothetical protein